MITKTANDGPSSRGNIPAPVAPGLAQLVRPLWYALGIMVLLFGLYEFVERMWLTEVDMQLLHLCHILRGIISTVIVAGVVGWMILKSSPGFMDRSLLEKEWARQLQPTEAERIRNDAQWFIAMRWMAVLIAGLLAFLIVRVLKWLPLEVCWPLAGLVGLLALSNGFYAVLVRRNRAGPRLLQTQAYLDLVILTGLLHFSGGGWKTHCQ